MTSEPQGHPYNTEFVETYMKWQKMSSIKSRIIHFNCYNLYKSKEYKIDQIKDKPFENIRNCGIIRKYHYFTEINKLEYYLSVLREPSAHYTYLIESL